MIAKNFIRYPEALRFQREMFSNGYKNSPRIMRLVQVIFSHAAEVPGWVKEKAAAAKRLAKQWAKAQIALNFFAGWKPTEAVPAYRAAWPAKGIPTKYMGPEGQVWSGRGLVPRWLCELVELGNTREQFRVQ